jgi:V/A-type H+-transporting ATPase subunit F
MLGFVIGDSDMITGLRLVGVEGVEVSSPDEALQALNKALAQTDLALIIVSEDFSTQPKLHETIDKARREKRHPLIVELPGSNGKPTQIRMSDLISKTLGIRM